MNALHVKIYVDALACNSSSVRKQFENAITFACSKRNTVRVRAYIETLFLSGQILRGVPGFQGLQPPVILSESYFS